MAPWEWRLHIFSEQVGQEEDEALAWLRDVPPKATSLNPKASVQAAWGAWSALEAGAEEEEELFGSEQELGAN